MGKSSKPPERDLFEDTTKGSLQFAALECFTQYGFGGTTMTMIAERAGHSKQIATYHFKTTETLLIELTALWGELGRRVTLEHLASLLSADPVDKIVGISDGNFLFAKTYPLLFSLAPVIFHTIGASNAVSKGHEANAQAGLERIKGFLKLGKTFAGLTQKELHALSLALHCQMYGAALYLISARSWEDAEIIRKASNQALRAICASAQINNRES